MSLVTLLIVILLIVFVLGMPQLGFNRSYGYGPPGIVGIMLVILVVLLLMGRL